MFVLSIRLLFIRVQPYLTSKSKISGYNGLRENYVVLVQNQRYQQWTIVTIIADIVLYFKKLNPWKKFRMLVFFKTSVERMSEISMWFNYFSIISIYYTNLIKTSKGIIAGQGPSLTHVV